MQTEQNPGSSWRGAGYIRKEAELIQRVTDKQLKIRQKMELLLTKLSSKCISQKGMFALGYGSEGCIVCIKLLHQ